MPKLQPHMKSQIEVVGIAWYRPEDYSLLLALFEDRENLPQTFAAWLAKAETIEQEVRSTGVRVVRVTITPHEFTRWCASRELRFNAEARSRFASERAT